MSFPSFSNIGYYLGTNKNPNNDTDPYGGSPDTAEVVDQTVPSNLWSTVSIRSTNYDLYSAHYRKADFDQGYLNYARFYNRAGCKLNTAAGLAAVVSSNPEDAGSQIRIVGKTGGNWFTETLTLGTSTVLGTRTWDGRSA